jgi:PiT family inorganic phosphate transporter
VDQVFLLLILIFAAGIAFNFINGFHDTANAIATVVSTRVLPLRAAIIIAAGFNVIGALSGTAVAETIGAGLVDPNVITQPVVLAALLGAVGWSLLTWYYGIPSSSSNALIGGLLGAAAVSAGFNSWEWAGIKKVVEGLVAAPVLGFAGGALLIITVTWLTHRMRPSFGQRLFRYLQLGSSSFMAFSHGSNDAQKTMGILTLALYTAGRIDTFEVPTWVIFLSAITLGLGTAAGGRRIIRTMGEKIIKLEPVHGFAAETSAAAVIYAASRYGLPVGTTPVISSAIMGVGAARGRHAVRWNVARQIVTAWVLTITASAVSAALIFIPINWLFG